MSKYSIRPVLWVHKKNSAGECPLKIRLTINRKSMYINTNFNLKESEWNKAAKEVVVKKGGASMNARIRQEITKIEEQINAYLIHGIPISIESFKSKKAGISFKDFAKEVRYDDTEINRLEKYRPGVLIGDIDVAFLRKFEQHERSRGMFNNTVNSTFKYLRRIINQAYAEKLIKENPFNEYDVPKYIQTDRTYLLEHEKQELIKLFEKDLSPALYNTLCYFLLGCYSGLRHSDWKQFNASMVEDGFLKLRASKNKVMVVLPIGPTLQSIIDRVIALNKPPYVLEQCNSILKSLGAMAGLKKHLTCHVARHSFGYMCAEKKLPKSVAAELMGVTVNTVNVYFHLSGENIIDQAAVLKTV
ncbi:MAG: site-specific integrase [Bacteroidetes bacterium]|nr:site-specific integrase [Bacteroidota bacterium]